MGVVEFSKSSSIKACISLKFIDVEGIFMFGFF